jgi:hypothetical protein
VRRSPLTETPAKDQPIRLLWHGFTFTGVFLRVDPTSGDWEILMDYFGTKARKTPQRQNIKWWEPA